MLGNMSEYMHVLKCHGAEHSKYSNLNLAIVLSRSFFLSIVLPPCFFYLSSRFVVLYFYRLPVCLFCLSIFHVCLSTNHVFFLPSLKPCQKKLGQSWTTYCAALVCYFRTWTILDNILCICVLFPSFFCILIALSENSLKNQNIFFY